MKKRKWINVHSAGSAEMVMWMHAAGQWLPKASKKQRYRLLERLIMLTRKERFLEAVGKDSDVRGLWSYTWFLAGGGEYEPW
jgi:hypothetical protein